MKRSNLLFSAIAVLMVVFFWGCSKDDDTTAPQQQKDPPVYAGKTITPPDALTQSSDPGAQQAAMYINMANGFAGMAGSYVTHPGKSQGFKSTNGDGPPWVYTWEVNDETGTYSVTLTINEDDSGSDWTMKITGVMDGVPLTDFTLLHGEQSSDAKTGNFTVYDYESGGIAFTMNWSIDDNDVYTLTIEVPQEYKLVIVSNPDGSGSVESYEWVETGFELAFEAVWDSTGHGQWWEYQGGEITNNGGW